MDAMYGTPMTGMGRADFQLEVVANNIANLNTSGYQEIEPVMESLQIETAPASADVLSTNAQVTGIGAGTPATSTERSQIPAPLVATGNPLDLAIQGPGYFSLRDGNGQHVYSKQVSLRLEADGQIATAQGLALSPPIRAGANVTAIQVDPRGRLIGETHTGQQVALGTLPQVTFPAPENLRALGAGTYSASLSSGRPTPTPAGSARILSGYQLGSSVDLSTEMVKMVQAERMYEINGKALQTLDSLVSGAINMQSH